MGSSLGRGLLFVAALIGLMVAVGSAVHFLYPSDWQPVEATVRSVQIESVRPGTPQWALMVFAAYEVEGTTYETTSDVFHDPDRAVTEAKQADWPAGRTFTIFVDAANPGSTSLTPDGGRQAATVVAIILTPVLLGIVGLILLLVRNARVKREDAA